MKSLEQAEHAARVLSQQQYQGYSKWCVERVTSKTFEHGEQVEQTESLNIVATTGGLGHLRLNIEEALAILVESQQEAS